MNPQSKKGFYGKTAKMSAIWDFGGRIGSQGVLFVASIVLARILTPADFGITSAARFFVTLASRLTQLGLNASLVRMKEIRPEHASSVFVANLAAGLLAFVSLYLAAPLVGRFFGSADVGQVLPVTAAVFLITPFGSVAAAMLNRHLRYRSTTLIQVLDGVAGTILSLLLAILGFGYWSLVYGALAGTLLSTTAKVIASPWRVSLRFSMKALRDTLGFGLGFQAKSLLYFGTRNLDNLVVGRLLGVTSLGFYDKAYGLMRQLTDRMAFDAALMRIFAILRDEPDRLRTALLKGIQATTLVTFPILCFSAAAAEPLIVVIFGSQWAPAVGPFKVLALSGLLRSSMRAVNSANDALGLVWLQTLQQLVSLLVMVVGVAIGCRWGLTTASFGVALGTIVFAMMSVVFLVRHSTVTARDVWRASWPQLATSVAMCLVALGADALLRLALTPPLWLTLLVMVVTAGLSLATMVLWTPFPSLRAVVLESVDDVAPWIRRLLPVGIMKHSVTT